MFLRNTGLITCPWKEKFPGLGKGYFRAAESGGFLLEVITLNESQMEGSDLVFSHPAWAIDSRHLPGIIVTTSYQILRDSKNIRTGGVSGSI